MPVTPRYPGVYVEEIPSGVRPITGVSTSITAFIGRARRGPVNEPVTINSHADFERIFGGLWEHSAMAFAVRDFYLNRGVQAIIVRLFHPASGTLADAAARLNLGAAPGAISLRAASTGEWGRKLRARVTNVASDATGEFDLTILDGESGVTETFRGVSAHSDHARRLDHILRNQSALVRLPGDLTPTTPPPGASASGDAGRDVWADNTPTPTNYKAVGDSGSDGSALEWPADFRPEGAARDKRGLYALSRVDLFNILCIPPYLAGGNVDALLVTEAAAFCESRRAMLLVDPRDWTTKDQARDGVAGVGTTSRNAALFFPRIRRPNPLRGGLVEDFAPCGAIAGVFARTDAERGVWKAPAGLDATLVGAPALSVPLTDDENGELNPLGINCLRTMPAAGAVVWGARTLQGNDRLASEWKYIPVRRLALFLEESLYRGTQWVVFEPNAEPLWAQIRMNVGAFMHGLFRQGAFKGTTPKDAYLVKCDAETTTQNDINNGIVNIVVGFAPLKPAEFVIIRIQQMTAEILT